MNNTFSHIENVYLIGIGGIGMSALAKYFNQADKNVAGYDRTETEITEALQHEAIEVHYEDKIELIEEKFKNKENTLIIYTPAIPSDHSELNYFKNNGFNVMKRSTVLGEISKDYFTIAVAGTHGKTTTSCLIAHLLKVANLPSIAILGGIGSNYLSNFWAEKDAKILITEADEYDRSFLTLNPDIAVITSVEPDHLDIYAAPENLVSGYFEFSQKLKKDGLLVLQHDIEKYFEKNNCDKITYGIENGDLYAQNVRIENHRYSFDVNESDYALLQPGKHNIENALAAIAVAKYLEISEEDIHFALKTFKGVRRRFEYQVQKSDFVYIDDYAHHPTELKAAISTARELYPDWQITGIFQPHLFSRTRDFSEDFAKSLSLLDVVILLPIYPAREKPISGVNSEMILKMVTSREKYLVAKKDLLNVLKNINKGVLMTLGAGDISDFVLPIKKHYLQE